MDAVDESIRQGGATVKLADVPLNGLPPNSAK